MRQETPKWPEQDMSISDTLTSLETRFGHAIAPSRSGKTGLEFERSTAGAAVVVGIGAVAAVVAMRRR